MPDDVIYMEPAVENTGTIFMEPLPELTGTIYMEPYVPTTPPSGEPPGSPSYSWVLAGSGAWAGVWSSTSWNTSPGDYSGAHDILTKSGGWNYIKITYVSNYWKNSAAVKIYQLYLKTDGGYGAFNTALPLSSSTQYAVGAYDSNPAGCDNTIYYAVYVSK